MSHLARTRPHLRTLEDVRNVLEIFARECADEVVRTGTSHDEAELLRAIIASADQARRSVLDVSVATARYISHCLEQDAIQPTDQDEL